MDLDTLRRSPIGRLVPISDRDQRWGVYSYYAFIPSPLPASIPLGEETSARVADAAMAVGRLDSTAQQLPNPQLLVRPALAREAVSTSALEGTFAPISEVLEGEIVGRDALSAPGREVLNYMDAAFEGIGLLKERPISLNMLARLQAILVRGTRGDSYDAGQVRQRQVYIGPEDQPIEQARFVPPPPGDDLRDGITAWERWIHADTATHLLVRIAVGHYQFEALHPFSDGNGRLGRLIVALQLVEEGVMRHPLLTISDWLKPRKEEYKDGLLRVSKTGDFDSWVGFFCGGIKAEAELAVERINRLLRLRNEFVNRVRTSGSRASTARSVAEQLIGFPLVDIPWVARQHSVSYPTAKDAVERLVELGLLVRAGARRGRGRPRQVFLCPAVMAELESRGATIRTS